MSMTDPIADMLTRIRNANCAGHEKADIPASKLKSEIIRLLKEEGYIRTYRFIDDGKQGNIRVYFKPHTKGEKTINGLRRVSRPGLRLYVAKDKLPRVLGGLGTAVISTSKGILSDRQARKNGVGGEHLLSIW
jgi:small subunit ribosomal protein S8